MTCAAYLFPFQAVVVSTDERGGSESNHAFDCACNTVEGERSAKAKDFR